MRRWRPCKLPGEYEAWRKRRLDQDRWVYLWADGIYSGLRAEDKRLCALVVIGVNERGQKHFLAIEDGIRESTQSWREVLLDLKARGFTVPAKLAVGDGALGFRMYTSDFISARFASASVLPRRGIGVREHLPDIVIRNEVLVAAHSAPSDSASFVAVIRGLAHVNLFLKLLNIGREIHTVFLAKFLERLLEARHFI
jgi:Transposase, Mutator family